MIESRGFHELVRQSQSGDRQALDRLMAAVRPHLERLAAGYAEPGAAGESTTDLVQEASLRVWQRLDQFRGADNDEQTAAMFAEWVGHVVRNLALNRREARQTQKRRPTKGVVRLGGGGTAGTTSEGGAPDPAASGPSPRENVRADEQRSLVRAALDRMPDAADREIVRLRFVEGLSLRQVSDRLEMSYDKVRKRYQAAVRRLQRELADLL